MAEFMSDEAIQIGVQVANGEDPPVAEDEERAEFRRLVKQSIDWMHENGFNVAFPADVDPPDDIGT